MRGHWEREEQNSPLHIVGAHTSERCYHNGVVFLSARLFFFFTKRHLKPKTRKESNLNNANIRLNCMPRIKFNTLVQATAFLCYIHILYLLLSLSSSSIWEMVRNFWNVLCVSNRKSMSPYRKENTTRFHYKDQLINVVYVNTLDVKIRKLSWPNSYS
jgi:hypothetical protein